MVQWDGVWYLVASEAAARRGVPMQTVYSSIRRGHLPALSVPGARLLLLLPADVDAWDVSKRPGPKPKKREEDCEANGQ